MNFFQHQDQARKQSRRLLGLFALAVLAVVAAVNCAAVVVFGFAPDEIRQGGSFLQQNLPIMIVATVATLLVIGIGSAWKTHSLRAQGATVAEALGGTRVPLSPNDFKLKRLRNVVEEISLASGVTVPAIYVIESEPGINAFAAGFNTEDAAVAVTRGCLDSLNREELQGVIAHEFSHILNGDMRLNLRLMGWLHGILLIGLFGEVLMRGAFWGSAGRSRRSNRNGGSAGAIIFLGIALLIIGYIGVFFARMIKSAVSRQREFLADASAVQFTRYPDGISGALQKIAVHADGSALDKPRAEQISHMLFASGFNARMLATHPPLDQRIKAIDPSWTPTRLDAARISLQQARQEAEQVRAATQAGAGTQEAPPPPVAGTAQMAPNPSSGDASSGAIPMAEAVAPIVASGWADAIGEPTIAALAWARQLRRQLPNILLEAAHDPKSAQWLLLALIASDDQQGRARLRALPDSVVPEDADHLWELIEALYPFQRLPLIEVILATLGELQHGQRQHLLTLAQSLSRADGEVTLFQYASTRLFAKSVRERLRKSSGQPAGNKRLFKLRKEVAWLFALFAKMAHEDQHQARQAWLKVTNRLFREQAPAMPEIEKHWQPEMDKVLIKLDQLRCSDKQILVESLIELTTHDGKITLAESELLRLLASLLHVPLPPLAALIESQSG